MARIHVTQDLAIGAEELWKLIGGFNALPEWHPTVEKSDLESEGQVRKLSLAGGATVVERLENLDDRMRTYSYRIEESPLPVRNYLATITVREADSGCTVEWSSEFEAVGVPEGEATKVIQGIYQAGFDNLKKRFGSPKEI